jgi:hypothetical protein
MAVLFPTGAGMLWASGLSRPAAIDGRSMHTPLPEGGVVSVRADTR